jgi:hypothetical protein
LLTDSITLKRGESDDQAILEIGSRARDHDASLTRLAEPRALSEPGTIVEAFTRLFG